MCSIKGLRSVLLKVLGLFYLRSWVCSIKGLWSVLFKVLGLFYLRSWVCSIKGLGSGSIKESKNKLLVIYDF